MRTTQDARRAGRALLPALALILAGPAPAPAQGQGQAPTPLAARVPAKDLLFYLQSDGLDAHQTEWKASAASKVLNETKFGALLEDLAKQGIDQIAKNSRGTVPSGGEVVALLKQVARGGASVGVNGNLEKGRLTLTFRGGARPEVEGLLLRVMAAASRQQAPQEVRKAGRKVTLAGAGNQTALIEDKGDLIICVAGDLDATLALLDGKEPSAVGNRLIAELSKAEGPFRPMLFGFFDPKLAGPLPPEALALGLGDVERVDFRWGFREDALYSVLRVKAPSPRKGLLALLDGPTFDRSTLPPMPAAVTGFASLSLSPLQVYEKVAAIHSANNPPNAPDRFARTEAEFEQATGVNLKGDLLAKLGPKMAGFSLPASAPGGLPIEVVVLAEVADPQALGESLRKVFGVIDQALKGPMPRRQAGQPTPRISELEVQGRLLGFELILPEGSVPPGPLTGMRPTLQIGEKYLAIGTMPGGASRALDAAEGRSPAWKPADAQVAMADLLPKSMVGLIVSDPRQTLPVLVGNLPTLLATANAALANRPGPPGQGPAIPIEVDPAKLPTAEDLTARLFPASSAVVVDAEGVRVVGRESFPEIASPGTAGVMVALLLPAVQASREAARRTQCVNNLKHFGLAMHNHHEVNGAFPPAAITDKDGKPLLSWRVAVLPFIEQNELYNKFKLDEPWDSANNKPLIAEMPRIFLCPSRKNPEAGTTCYCAWTGENTAFDGPNGRGRAAIPDGTSNTLHVVESSTPVIWSKPDDLAFDPQSKLPNFGAGSLHPGGFNTLFADGSVRFLKNTINQIILKALISPAGGEVINADAF